MENFDVILPIGISGSGKTTWVKPLESSGYTVVSPDDIRREITGNVSDQTQNKLVFKIAYARMFDILDNGGSVIFDATNVNTMNRVKMCQAIWNHKHNAKIGYKLFDGDVDLSYERIANDISNGVDRSNVPLHALQRQYADYQNTIEQINSENLINIDSI